MRKIPSITDLLGVLFALGSVVSIAPSGRAAALILPPPSTWTASAELTGTIGYKDNLLLSSYAPESSAFAGAAADLMWWHLPQGPVDYVVYLNADGRRYFSGQAVDHEAFAALFGEWRRRLPDQGQFAFDLRGFYSDRVLDISDTAVQRVVAPIKVSGVNTGPVLRWNFSPRWWGEWSALGAQTAYAGAANNHAAAEGGAKLGFKASEHWSAVFAAQRRERAYVRRRQYSVSGRELEGTRLRVVEDESTFRLEYERASLQTSLRAAHVRFADNGIGYLGYRRDRLASEVEWKQGDWRWELEASVARKIYAVQTVGFGIVTPYRREDEVATRLRVERRINARWLALVELSTERVRSNDALSAYHSKEGLLGLRWNWEK